VQVVLAQPAAPRQNFLRCRRHLVERVRDREALLGGEPLHLLPELRAELGVVARDQRTPIEGEIVRRKRVDGPAHDVRDHEVAGVDRSLVLLAPETLRTRPERQQGSIAREVRGRAGRRTGEGRRRPGEPGPGEPESQDLLNLQTLNHPEGV
jgi:hypothetical protein